MDNLNLISNFAEFKELKNIDKSTMIGVLEDVFRHALQKQYETDENFDVIINPEKGDLEIWRNRTVVEDGAVENPNTQIAVSEVKAHRPDLRDRRRICRRDQTRLVRPPRRVVAAPEPGIAHPRPGEGQPLREIFGEGRRDCHRRSLSGVEKGGADPRRRGERADPAQGGADSQRLLPQGGHH